MNKIFKFIPSFFNKPETVEGEGEMLSDISADSTVSTRSSDAPSAGSISVEKTLTQWNQKNVWIVPSLAAGMTFVLASVLMAGVLYQTKHLSTITQNQSAKTANILSTLHDVDAQVETLSAHPAHSRDFNVALGNIHQDMSKMQKSLSTRNEVTKVSTEISSMQNDMDAQMGDLRKEVVGSNSKAYLDAKVLPFSVISIDVISQQPFVTIKYDHHQTPLGVGDSLAGWKITNADYQKGFVEFENSKSQYVKVNLQGTSA